MRTLLLLALAACGDNIDEDGEEHGLADVGTEYLTATGATHGTVYRCESGAMCLSEDGGPATEEWCWDGEERELEVHLGLGRDGCHPIKASERFFPWLVGCAYHCDPPPGFRGANAHCGAFCPTVE